MKRPSKLELEFTVFQCLKFIRDEKDLFFPPVRQRAEEILKLIAKTLRDPSLRDAYLIEQRYKKLKFHT
jgi:hypothetical protein